MYRNPNYGIEQRISDLISRMTLQEKIGQMNQYNGFWDVTGPVPEKGSKSKKYDHLRKGWVGSMLNVRGVNQVRTFQEIAVKETRLGIPLIFGFDVIHGYKVQAPIPLAESASWDLEAIEKSARIAAEEASAAGLNWTFAPMVDITRDARWGRVMEGAGEDPYLGSAIARARVLGFQGDDLSAPNTIAACAKHFAGYGFAESGKDYNTTEIGNPTLYNVILPPFKATVDAGIRTFMNAFNTINNVPATGDSYLQRNILKGTWNFDGFVVSDWGSIREMVKHGFARDLKHAGELAAIAGSDMDMESSAYINHLMTSVNEGKVKTSEIDEAVTRILRVKFELGLFDDPFRYCDQERERTVINSEENIKGVLDMALRSVVLLKNTNDLLPIRKDQLNIAVIGDLADDKNSPLGSWRLGAENNTAVSVLEGLEAYNADYTFIQGPKIFNDDATFRRHVKVNSSDTTGIGEAVKAAKKAKVVIMVLGEHGFMTGEGRSRTKVDLPGVQKELLRAVQKVNPNIVLVLTNGRPLDLSWEDSHIPAILETWHLGSQSGHAIAQVLFGDYNPSGKLPMSFPRNVGQLPLYYNHLSTGRPDPSIGVFWSHYTDSENSALYPFGYGLSYTKYTYEALRISQEGDLPIEVSVRVTNTGDIAGEEVVQLYLQDVVASIARPVKELKGFKKIHLEPGASKTISFTITEKELGFFDQQYNWKVENGLFNLWIGPNSAEGLQATFEINKY